jgi:hypothetical protein
MRLHGIFVLLALGAGVSSAQTAVSAASNAVVAPTKPTKPPAKPKAETPKPKYLVGVHDLTIAALQPQDCYASTLQFPATNADQVAKALASEPDYTFAPIGQDRIAIYYKFPQANPPRLQAIKHDMDELAAGDFRYAKAVRVPPGSAARTLRQLNLPADSSMTATAVDDNCILLLSKTNPPDPVTIAILSKSLPQIYWSLANAQPTQRLFHLDASAVVKKLSSQPDSADKSSGDSGSSDSTGSKPPAKDKSSSKTDAASTPKSSATPPSTVAQNVAVSVATGGSPAQGGSDADGSEAPDSSDGSGSGKNSADKGSGSNPAKTKKDSAAPAKPLTMQAVNDTLVYSNEDGSDKGFSERNRLMAILDLPRPEVLMNIWSLQVSTRDPKIASLEAESANELVSHHNDVLARAIEQGWDALSRKMANRNFFERQFYEYVTKRFAEAEPFGEGAKGEVNHPHNDTAIGTEARERWGWCDPDHYCLGFIHAFEPVRPTLSNILLTIIAAHDSQGIADYTIGEMECPHRQSSGESVCPGASSKPPESEVDQAKVSQFAGCISKELKSLNTLRQESAITDCELVDRITLLQQVNNHQEEGLPLQCFREQAEQSFGPGNGRTSGYAATRVGLLRAAVADFLFNFKWATQYPHEFIPYDLTQSAQELNAEFNPLVLAFNRDVKAFTQNLETELQCKHDANHPSALDLLAWFRRSDNTFLNDGTISVRGISGVESVVDTVTQSFFDATNPPSLTDLVKSVSDAEKNVPGVLKTNLSANEAAVLLGALNSVQPAQAKIGRELKLDITPHALAGASSAELEIKLTADETANPTLFKSGKQEEDTLSRVAKHDTNTRVRVESLKLFDVSEFTAMLQRPRSKFPIIPPLFEVPYFGSFVGLPLPGARVYHRSTAIVSAIIVPTATDLAFGIKFVNDRVCRAFSQPLECHSAHSLHDFGTLPVRNFHLAMVQCFASGGKRFYPGKLLEPAEETGLAIEGERIAAGDNLCANLSLGQPGIAVPPADFQPFAPATTGAPPKP